MSIAYHLNRIKQIQSELKIKHDNMSIKTVQKYALSIGTTPQNVTNKKSLPLVKCPIYALHKGEYIYLKDQIFVEVEEKTKSDQ